MNILFLTLLDFESLDDRNIYTDLLREFQKRGHNIYAISPVERRRKKQTKKIVLQNQAEILKLKIGNIQKTNIVEKGISTLTIEWKLVRAIKQYYSSVKFDMVLYATPPITFCRAIEFVKKRDNAKSYLMLKDIFPQNAVDMGVLNKNGWKGILYRYFRDKEKKLYQISDYIGCMSQANVDYVLVNNPELNSKKVEICPNSIEIIDKSVNDRVRADIRKKYNIPLDKKVFVYGGNLGRPQGIGFLIECLKTQGRNKDVFFLIVGDGTEYEMLQKYVAENHPENVKVMKRLPKEDYETMVAACDVGMIFLDYRFTIPNFPSRLLSYMQAKIPVLACTDANTDIGKIIVDGGFGWWCESRNVCDFEQIVKTICDKTFDNMKNVEYQYLADNYNVVKTCRIITKRLELE